MAHFRFEPRLATISSTTPTDTLNYNYDHIGDLLTAGDAYSSYSFAYNALGQQTSVDNSGTPNMPHVVLTSSYDTNGDRTGLNSTIAGTADFQNSYTYDAFGNETGVTQQGAAGGDAVAAKNVTFGYDLNNDLTSIKRYASTTTSNLVATSSYDYDHDGNLTSLSQVTPIATIAGYTWFYDSGGRVTRFADSQDSTENLSYWYDADNQLTRATYTGSSASEESYGYDPNGNRTSAVTTNGSNTCTTANGTTTGNDNQIANDGTNAYEYDADGNLIESTSDTTLDYIVYAYDNRNRLTSVSDYNEGSSTPTQQVSYTYDVFNNLIGESVTKSSGTTNQAFVFDDPMDNGQMVLAFGTTGLATPTAANLTDRYLWGPAVDQLMSDEQITAGLTSAGTVEWALGDNENTIRDWVNSSGTSSGHATYNAFGLQTGASGFAASADVVFGYTGKFYDTATKLQWNVDRWYNPETGTWMSRDPIGFSGGQANLSEYVGNDPTDVVDPSGLFGWGNVFGVVQTVGGLIETTVGASVGIAAGWTGVGAVAGGAVAIHGLDVTQAGLRQVYGGSPVDTVTSLGLQSAGVSRGTANLAEERRRPAHRAYIKNCDRNCM